MDRRSYMKYAIGGVVAVAGAGFVYYLCGRSRKSETLLTSTAPPKNYSKVGLTILDANVGDIDWHHDGNPITGQPVNGLDIYELELPTGDTKRLTDTFDDWDEHAHYSPDGKTIMWMSGKELEFFSKRSESVA